MFLPKKTFIGSCHYTLQATIGCGLLFVIGTIGYVFIGYVTIGYVTIGYVTIGYVTIGYINYRL